MSSNKYAVDYEKVYSLTRYLYLLPYTIGYMGLRPSQTHKHHRRKTHPDLALVMFLPDKEV